MVKSNNAFHPSFGRNISSSCHSYLNTHITPLFLPGHASSHSNTSFFFSTQLALATSLQYNNIECHPLLSLEPYFSKLRANYLPFFIPRQVDRLKEILTLQQISQDKIHPSEIHLKCLQMTQPLRAERCLQVALWENRVCPSFPVSLHA